MATTAPTGSPPSQPSLTHPPPRRKLTTVKALSESLGLLPSLPFTPSQNNPTTNQFQTRKNQSPPSISPSSPLVIPMNGLKPSENSEKAAGTGASSWYIYVSSSIDVTNHGVPERKMKAIIEACREFFELPEEEKRGISGKHVLDPIRFGTSFNESVDEILCWRDYVKIFQHPEFDSPNKPPSFRLQQHLPKIFREIALEYSKRVRLVAREIIRGISESLGLEKDYIDETLNLENGLQLIAANLYPPCPRPELAMGLPPHSDHGLLTLLIQNQIGGLQVQHKGKWVNIDPIPNSFLANIGDHIEVQLQIPSHFLSPSCFVLVDSIHIYFIYGSHIMHSLFLCKILSNGKYKSVLHRAVVNNRDVRISIAVPHGPALDAIVSPASKLVENVGNPPAYGAMKYKEYLELQQGTMLNGKSCLERIRNGD
ncbi:hypothetical protein Gotur_022356 [Gossypium turneri]